MNASNRVMTMNKRNQRLASAVTVAVLMAAGCDQGLTDVNENPNAPESVPVENLLLGGIWDVAANNPNRGVFGRWTQLMHAENWAQHVAQPVYNDEDNYTPRSGVPDNIWDEMYFALNDLHEVKAMAEAAGEDNIWAIAEIVTVYGFMVLTDYFDAIPYTEALSLLAENAVSFPAYDQQSDIYPDLIARLVAAAALIDVAALVDFGGFDPVYQGDMDGWRRFANSLQLRLAMRMADTPSAAAAQTAFVAAWSSQKFSSVDNHADVDWDGVQPSANPIYEAIVFGGRPGDFRMSQSLVDRLAMFSDPRLAVYAQPAVSDGQYRGLRNGLLPAQYTPPLGSSDFSEIGSYFLDAATPSVFMSYAEMLFLGAEAAERGWIADVASVLYADGIAASMEEFAIDAADIATYLAQPGVDYATGTYTGLAAIYVQKWMGLFLAGPEAFSEMRRVGWMDLVPAGNSVLGPGEFPARLYYPDNEPLFNPENYPGDTTVDMPVWWMN